MTKDVHKNDVFKVGIFPKRLKHENLFGDQDKIPLWYFEADDPYEQTTEQVL